MVLRAEDFIDWLRARGISLRADGAKLGAEPRERLTSEDREAIRQHKLDLLRLLADPYGRAKALGRRCESTRADLADLLDREPDLRAALQTATPEGRTPSHSIVAVCQRYGVLLRIDPATGDLVIGKAGAKADELTQPWQSLLAAIEAHLEDVSRLVEAGWSLKAPFPRQAAT